MRILSNVTKHTTKLIGRHGAMIQWRAGANKEEFRASCEKAECIFMLEKDGEPATIYMDPISGETINENEMQLIPGTISEEPEYLHEDGRILMKVDKCFALFGTPMLGAFEWDIKFPERLGIEGLRKAISEAPRYADRARGALVGNASTMMSEEDMKEVDGEIRGAGMHHILYDHAWRQNPWILEFATASCNHLQDVRDAIALGARQCSLVMPQSLIDRYQGTMIDGFFMNQCPENVSPAINCINCGGRSGPLCDARTRSGMVVMFEQHGATSWKKSRSTKIRNIAGKAGVSVDAFQKMIREGDRPAILSIGLKAMSKVTKATAKGYRAFLEMS